MHKQKLHTLDSEGTLPEGEGELLLASAPADLANAVETISHTPAEITSLNKLMHKELPITIDLDDPAQTRHCLYRYEVVCLQHHANQDNHVGLLEPRLEQGKCNKFQEKTRLLAVFNWTNTHRGPDGMLPYAGFKSVILQVVGGEPVIYSRKTLHALSQKSSGSFDTYLADFETMAAYVHPSAAEKLEVFMAGLNSGLRSRVLCRLTVLNGPVGVSF